MKTFFAAIGLMLSTTAASAQCEDPFDPSFWRKADAGEAKACLETNPDAVAGLDPHGSGNTLLHIVVSTTNDPDVVWSVLRAGADPNIITTTNRKSPLHLSATFSRNPAVILALVLAGADVDAPYEDNACRLPWSCAGTALHIVAKRKGAAPLAAALLASGAEVNANDNEEKTPLYLAAETGDPRMVRLLLEQNASVDSTSSKSSGKMTPLMIALEKNTDKEIIDLLLERGASLSATNANKQTPLFIGAIHLSDPGTFMAVFEATDDKCRTEDASANVDDHGEQKTTIPIDEILRAENAALLDGITRSFGTQYLTGLQACRP